MMEKDQIETVVRNVLSAVLKNSPAPAAEITKPKSGGRRLANENIARWLGHEAQSKNASQSSRVKLPTRKTVPSGSTAVPARKTVPSGSMAVPAGPVAPVPGEIKNQIPNPRHLDKLLPSLDQTPARIGVWRAGTRYLTRVALKLRADHAVAKDAVYAELPAEFATANGLVLLMTKAKSKEEFLLRPDLGRQLDDASLKIVQEKAVKNPDVQITVADGLSSWAAERYAMPMVKELVKLCGQNNYSVGTLFCVKHARIAIQDVIGEAVNAKISIILLGERPGLGSGDSLSNYMVYGPKTGIVNAKKSMISNIHPLGHTPEDAAKMTVDMFKKMFEQKCSGVDLQV